MPKPVRRIHPLSAPRDSQRSQDWHTRGYLPHRNSDQLFQFITFRLHDSVPAETLQSWKDQLNWRAGLPSLDPINIALQQNIQHFEDLGHGECHLRNPTIAKLVQDALHHFHAQRYLLHDWSIMPNHVHVLIQTAPGYPLEEVVHSWKSYTAKAANKSLARTGEFWMRDYYDRFIRDETHYNDVVTYIHSQGFNVVAQNAR